MCQKGKKLYDYFLVFALFLTENYHYLKIKLLKLMKLLKIY